jgi:pre-mRNA cleavage complex 2 protein Pcf11
MLPNLYGAVEVKLTSASIKISRPQMISGFLNARPNQCSTCGKRFLAVETAKKERHMDWHFKTKQRGLESEKRGQNRSWYVDEREWIASKEYEDDAGDDAGSQGDGAKAAEKKAPSYIKVPTDPSLRSLPCPIDQEPFKNEWSEDVQDWVWHDAVQVGNRIYHRSCYEEVTKGRSQNGVNTPINSARNTTPTPDSVLGKRKAIDEGEDSKSRIKLESASMA